MQKNLTIKKCFYLNKRTTLDMMRVNKKRVPVVAKTIKQQQAAGGSMNRQELIKRVAADVNITQKAAGNALGSIIGHITIALQAEKKVSLIGFGSFEISQRKERKGRNPRTNKEISIPAHKVPVFRASKKLKEVIK